MAQIDAEIDFKQVPGQHGGEIDGVCATCSKCGHTTESAGTSEASVTRCLVLLREGCLEGERNFYKGDL